MGKLLVILFFFLNITVYCATYYVATPANGGDNAHPGTFSEPWATWQKAFDVTIAGDIVYIKGGIYYSGAGRYGVSKSNKSGTASQRIIISAYSNYGVYEPVILDCSPMTYVGSREGIYMNNCSYYTFIGLSVRNCKEYSGELASGWVISKCSYINFDRCNVYDCANGFSSNGFCDYIVYENCDAYRNQDYSDGGGFANGFTLTMYESAGPICAVGTHVTLKGCRAFENSDDGFDTFGANGYFLFIDCWAWDNGWNGGGEGNGDGFKSEQSREAEPGIQRIYIRCMAWANRGQGFCAHIKGDNNNGIHHLYNCVSYKNLQHGFGYGIKDGTTTPPCLFRDNIAYKNAMQQFGGLLGYIEENNSWNGGIIVTDADFVNLNGNLVSAVRKPKGGLPDIHFPYFADIVEIPVEIKDKLIISDGKIVIR